MENEKKRIGQIIKDARKARNLTQMGLSELIGVSYQQVQKYEKGSDNISVERLKQIALAVNVPIALFFPESETVAETHVAYKKTPADETLLLELYRGIKSKRAKKAVIELLKTFTAK
jgi:transcriptional regulator with XRE-family HTH domain